MITTARQIAQELSSLCFNDNFILVVDEDDNEYVIDNITKRKLHTDDNTWCYALKIRKSNNGCVKR